MESCLPPISLLIAHRQRLAALRVVCSPPSVNPATARLHPSFPSLSAHRAPDSSRAMTRGLSSVYLPLHWKTPRPVPPIRNYLPVDAVAHRTIPFTLELHQQKNVFLRTEGARFRTNSICSLRPVLPDLPCLLCLSFLASGAPGRPTFPPQRPTRWLRPHPLQVPPPCVRPLILLSTGLLPTPCGCARPATISATLTPLAT